MPPVSRFSNINKFYAVLPLPPKEDAKIVFSLFSGEEV
jgi:hypothetical protein